MERAALEEEVRKSVWRTSVKYQTGDENQGVDARSGCGWGPTGDTDSRSLQHGCAI